MPHPCHPSYTSYHLPGCILASYPLPGCILISHCIPPLRMYSYITPHTPSQDVFLSHTLYPQPVHCVVCDLYLPNMSALNNHEKDKHSLFAYKCGECSKIFNTQSAFKEHERYHAGYKQCPTCSKKFLNEERLVWCFLLFDEYKLLGWSEILQKMN